MTRAEMLDMAAHVAPKWRWYGWRTEIRGYLHVDCSTHNERRIGSTGTIMVWFSNGQWHAKGDRAQASHPRDTLAAALRECVRNELQSNCDDTYALNAALDHVKANS